MYNCKQIKTKDPEGSPTLTGGSVQNELSVGTHGCTLEMASSETTFRSLPSKGTSREPSKKHRLSVCRPALYSLSLPDHPHQCSSHFHASELLTTHYTNVLQKCATSRKLLSPPFFLNSYINLRKKKSLGFPPSLSCSLWNNNKRF